VRQTSHPAEWLLAHYLPALLAGERQAVLDMVVEEGLGRGLLAPDIYLRVVQPALYRIGNLWAARRIGVADEHVATELSRLVLAHLYAFLPCKPGIGKTTVVACVEGEEHELGARMVADFLEMGGFEVLFVGTGVPIDELVALVRGRRPQMLALSATCAAQLPALAATVAAVRAAIGDRVVLAAGGQALDGTPNQLDVDIWGGDAYSVVAAARRALRV
jgi:MerR family transcriptional regulator, light-induced transcriptional regulator